MCLLYYRLNDVAIAIRILEAVKEKAGGDPKLYGYVVDSVRPTLACIHLKSLALHTCTVK